MVELVPLDHLQAPAGYIGSYDLGQLKGGGPVTAIDLATQALTIA